MAQGSWIKRTINVIIVPHAEAKFRQLKIPYWMILASGITLLGIVTALSIFLLHYFLMLDSAGKVAELYQQNQTLTKENLRYAQETNEIGKSLDKITKKTEILSSIAGVDQVVTRGRGDIGDFENNFGNENLDSTIPLQRIRVKDLETTLKRVEAAYKEKGDKLDFTPSIWPLISTELGYISSRMGMRNDPITGLRKMHNGIDISAPSGTPVIAPANGIVLEAKNWSGLGNVISIDHHNGFMTRYGHLKGFNVAAGDRVVRGQIIGFVGNTGRSTSSHLHYQVELNDKYVNPKNYILNYEQLIKDWDFQFSSFEQ